MSGWFVCFGSIFADVGALLPLRFSGSLTPSADTVSFLHEVLTFEMRELLQEILLTSPNLSHSNFRGANFSGVRMRGVDLSYACLAGADLSGSDLTGADLRNANLEGAKLEGTILPNDLSGVFLSNVD